MKEITKGWGADVVFDVVGETPSMNLAMYRLAGRILIVGFTSGRIAFIRTNRIPEGCSIVGSENGSPFQHDPTVHTKAHEVGNHPTVLAGHLKPLVLHSSRRHYSGYQALATRQSVGKVVISG